MAAGAACDHAGGRQPPVTLGNALLDSYTGILLGLYSYRYHPSQWPPPFACSVISKKSYESGSHPSAHVALVVNLRHTVHTRCL